MIKRERSSLAWLELCKENGAMNLRKISNVEPTQGIKRNLKMLGIGCTSKGCMWLARHMWR